ncbi:50S ribosomal protein L6 [Pseudobdellovibrio exovorus]|uniref:Large ribosomal subunit protein uL6 n=1 Tax=Pseudobdellovibrio exovorus JSS TaxID=1184267 RepID=M4VA73_9BACT|nr:50S ribosomal protein L6 [Pseudobdellovibrio exovorus]AGH96113.1 50S ribosomal protein L6 [Pseudobdellovibrio exovorus JSS]
MSRIGKYPVNFDEKVQVSVAGQLVTIKGAKSALKYDLDTRITAKVDGKTVVLTRADDSKESKSLHGLYKVLIQNAVTGLTTGFTKSLELHGVGYRANVQGKKLELSLGFSHPINFDIPEGIEIKVDKQTTVVVTGADKALVGQVAAKIRGYRPPEPYLGKGVRYSGEHIRRKAGKSAGK